MPDVINIVFADDHIIFREGLKVMLRNEKSVSLIGEAENGLMLLDLLKEIRPDVLLVDINMPKMSGLDAIRIISKTYPAIRIIALTMHDQDHMMIDALEAGALGYVLKDADKNDILEAIHTVFMSQAYFSSTITMDTIKRISASQFNPYKNKTFRLSDIDKQIMVCICKEMISVAIAAELHLSVHTIESYRKEILKKIGAKSMAGVALFAVKNGIYKF